MSLPDFYALPAAGHGSETLACPEKDAPAEPRRGSHDPSQNLRLPSRDDISVHTWPCLDELFLAQYRRPHPFARGLALSEPHPYSHATDDTSRASTEQEDATDTTLEPHSPSASPHAAHRESAEIPAEHIPRTEDVAPEGDLGPRDLQWSSAYEQWMYNWTLDAALRHQLFLDEGTWGRWFAAEQVSG